MSGKHFVLEGDLKLLSTLSHKGESSGPDSLLSRVTVVNEDYEPVQVFVYSGNAFRGMLRDLAAEYMIERLSIEKMGLELFYLLWSGGAIGGDQTIDIDQARRFRQVIPMISLFGGGIGNQLMGGKMAVGSFYPVCGECSGILPKHVFRRDDATWHAFVNELSFNRTDDAKNERLRERFIAPNLETPALTGDKAKSDRKPQQMRYTEELMAGGVRFYQRLDFIHVTDLELGVFVSALHEWQKHPYLGGEKRKGDGLCELSYTWREAGKGPEEAKHFLTVGSDRLVCGEKAEETLEAYNEFLATLYDQYLSANKATLQGMLEAGGAS